MKGDGYGMVYITIAYFDGVKPDAQPEEGKAPDGGARFMAYTKGGTGADLANHLVQQIGDILSSQVEKDIYTQSVRVPTKNRH